MAKQETATEKPDDLVWAKSPATGRKKEMRRDRLEILRISGWEPSDPPGDDAAGEVVSSFPSVPLDHGSPGETPTEADDASTTQSGNTRRGSNTQKES